jgi:hypothetical protein
LFGELEKGFPAVGQRDHTILRGPDFRNAQFTKARFVGSVSAKQSRCV